MLSTERPSRYPSRVQDLVEQPVAHPAAQRGDQPEHQQDGEGRPHGQPRDGLDGGAQAEDQRQPRQRGTGRQPVGRRQQRRRADHLGQGRTEHGQGGQQRRAGRRVDQRAQGQSAHRLARPPAAAEVRKSGVNSGVRKSSRYVRMAAGVSEAARGGALLFRGGETTGGEGKRGGHGLVAGQRGHPRGQPLRVSPLAETIAAPEDAAPGHGRASRGACLARRPSARLPRAAGRRPGHRRCSSGPLSAHRWNADFLTPTPAVARQRRTRNRLFDRGARARPRDPPGPPAPIWPSPWRRPAPRPPAPRDDLPERTAGLLEWVWTGQRCCPTGRGAGGSWRPMSSRATARVEPGRLGGGPGRDAARDALARREPAADHTHDYPPRELAGARLLFVPVTPRRDLGVVGRPPGPGGRGTPWCTRARAPLAEHRAGRRCPRRWARLLGPARAGVLVLLGTPEEHDPAGGADRPGPGFGGPSPQGPARRPARRRRRAGRSVLYFRTEAGEALVAAQCDG